jgi:transposase-like protein
MSVTAGTVMNRSKVPLTMWFWAAYLVAVQTPGISAVQLGKHLGLRYETAFQLLHKLRAGLVNPGRTPLRGVVEVDETFIGGRKKGRRGRGAEGKSLVIGAVEVVTYRNKKGKITECAGRVRLQKIPDASGDELMQFLKENVAASTVVRTDGWTGYNATAKNGYRHQVLTGETSIEVAEQLVHVHRVFSNLKTWLMGTHHGVSGKHLQAYLNEHTFRFNRRQSPFQSFASALGIATKVQGPEYEELYHAGEEGGWSHDNHHQ